jgi:hypothetical protein
MLHACSIKKFVNSLKQNALVKKYKYVSKEAEKLNRAIVKNNKSNAIIS